MAGRQCGTRSRRLRSNNPQMIMPMASPPHRLGAHDRVAPFMSQRAQPSETTVERMAQRDTYENVDLNRGSFNDTSDRVRVSSAFDFINQTHAAIIIKVMRGLGMRKDPSRRK